ncbi:ATP-binding protein [Rhodoferax sp.]|uniref:ATP-binding protein n=1 Tax=Rhodoferax sp. TaxID=50421 RepID=UPI0025E94668|nr:ATP-binding protein [Rhodoferax sp.]MCM2341322.1 ATP-binding protein [Rhodoferax sp.]
MTISSPRRVKATLMWPFAMVLTFILTAFVTTAYFLQVQVRDRALSGRVAAVAKLVNQKLDKDTSLMRAVMHTMQGIPAIGAAFAAQDRDALLREAGPLFQTLRSEHRITHLYFNNPELVNLVRLHSPDEFGGQIKRTTAVEARSQNKITHGLELGALGTLTLRVVAPWPSAGGVLGYVEMGEEIGHLVQEIHDSLSVDLLVLVDKQLLPAQQWQHGLALLERQGNWDRFTQQVMVAYTKADIPVAMNDSVLAALRMGETQVFSESRQTLHLAMLPLVDSNGQRIGDMVVMRDITGLEGTFQRSITMVTFLSLLVGAFVLGLFYFALDRVERDYQRQHDLEHQLLRLDTEHARILQVEKLSALGTMVGEIAHQLNNPLVGVVNLAQLAQREANNPARTRELLAEIRHAGQDCHAFIASMLRFAKVSKFDCHSTDMAQVVNETVLMFRQTIRRQIQVELVLPDQPVVLMADPILLRHALFNLLVNAAQATEGDGAIVISLQAQPHPETGAPGWRLAVRDHGKGIAPEILDKVFTPFFTTRHEGTGLGLPVVQHVALLHQGFVSVENLPEGGTQFAVWLPQAIPCPLQHPT